MNLDALYLLDLATRISWGEDVCTNETIARLRQVADNLQGLDDRSATDYDRGYTEGYAMAETRQRKRSNILESPEGEDETGTAILRQIDKLVAEGGVKRLALGERALEDRPHIFNAPMRPVRTEPKAKPPKPKAKAASITLDLDFLNDL